MFVISNLLTALAQVISLVLNVYSWIIIIRALISWVTPDPFNPIVQFLERSTEPVLAPVRRRLPAMAIDISPLIVLLAIMFLQRFLVQTLLDIAITIR